MTMFPQLIAGPILKYHQVERYLQDRRTDLDAISYGVKRFVTGLAKRYCWPITWDFCGNR
ncbi:MAG: hypothetical protein ACLR6I_01820 [Waltera sp.]